MRREVRFRSRVCRCSSRRDMALLTPDTDICSFCAADVRLAPSATVTTTEIALRLSADFLVFDISQSRNDRVGLHSAPVQDEMRGHRKAGLIPPRPTVAQA